MSLLWKLSLLYQLGLFNVTFVEIEPAVLTKPAAEIELFPCYTAGSISTSGSFPPTEHPSYLKDITPTYLFICIDICIPCLPSLSPPHLLLFHTSFNLEDQLKDNYPAPLC